VTTITTAKAPAIIAWFRRQDLLSVLLLVLVGLLVAPPVFAVMLSGFTSGDTLAWTGLTLDNYTSILGDPYTYVALGGTAMFAVGSTLFALILATGIGWLVVRTDAPFGSLVFITATATFAVPSVIKVIGWVLLLGPTNGVVIEYLRPLLGEGFTLPLYSMAGMIFVHGLVLFPMVFLVLVPALRAADASLEEAAMVHGARRLVVMRRVTAPILSPSILGAALLAFIVSIEAFEVPALIGTPSGVPVLSTEIFRRIKAIYPDYAAAGALATMLMILGIVCLRLYHRTTARGERFASVTGKGFRPVRIQLGKGRWVGGAINIVFSIILASPLLIVAWTSFLPRFAPPSVEALKGFTLENYVAVFEAPNIVAAARNSLVSGAVSALIVMALALVISWYLVNHRNVFNKITDQLVTLPLVVPGIVLSLAILRTYIPTVIYGTVFILIVAYVIHYLPYGMRFGHAGLLTVHSDLQEAGKVSGAGMLTVWRRILVPLLVPTLIAGWVFVFLSTVRQLSVVLFLAGPGREVAAVTLFQLWEQGSVGTIAAFAVLVVLVTVSIAVTVFLVTRKSAVAPL
jgi:iron(III) transport system permease protein